MPLPFSLPPATRSLLALLTLITVAHQLTAYLSSSQNDILALIPQYTIFYPWVFLTATFAEPSILTLPLALATLFYGGRYLERAWGSIEFAKLVLLVTVVPNVTAMILYVIRFAMTHDYERAHRVQSISGTSALISALLVALKQLLPEHTLTLLSSPLKFRLKHAPALFLLIHTLSGILLGTDTALTLAWSGFFTSWVYLRFYKASPDVSSSLSSGEGEGAGRGTFGSTTTTMLRGDPSETFTFASFFPDAAQPPITLVADRIYDFFIVMKVLKPFSAMEVEVGNARAGARGDGGGVGGLLERGEGGGIRGSRGKREEAEREKERRRKLALKALDLKLLAATGGTAGGGTHPGSEEGQPQTAAQKEEGRGEGQS